MLHMPSVNYLLPAAKQEPYYILTKNIEDFSGGKKKSGKWISRGEKDRKSNRTQQTKKKRRGDSKVESNDRPDYPLRGNTSVFSGLPSVGGE